MEIPSAAIRCSIKKKYLDKNLTRWSTNDEELKSNLNLVKLDWASTENGSHILMVCLANQVFVYSCVKNESLQPSASSTSTDMSMSKLSGSASQTMLPGHLQSKDKVATSPTDKPPKYSSLHSIESVNYVSSIKV